MGVLVNRIYPDIQDKHYFVKEIAIDSETAERVVVFQMLYGDYKTYAMEETKFLERLSDLDLNRAEKPTKQNDKAVIPNRTYRHFKGKNYLVKEIVFNFETDERIVIYQKLYGDYATYARKETMFLEELSEEDQNRKDNITNQKTRFVPVETKAT